MHPDGTAADAGQGAPLNSGMQSRSTDTSVAAEVSRSTMTHSRSIQKKGELRNDTVAPCCMRTVMISPAGHQTALWQPLLKLLPEDHMVGNDDALQPHEKPECNELQLQRMYEHMSLLIQQELVACGQLAYRYSSCC